MISNICEKLQYTINLFNLNQVNKTQMLTTINKRLISILKPVHLATYLLNPRVQGVFFKYVATELIQYRTKEALYSKSFTRKTIKKNLNP